MSLSETIQLKVTEQSFPVLLFIMLYRVVLTFESVDEILECGHSSESQEQYFVVVLFIMLYKEQFLVTHRKFKCAFLKPKQRDKVVIFHRPALNQAANFLQLKKSKINKRSNSPFLG